MKLACLPAFRGQADSFCPGFFTSGGREARLSRSHRFVRKTWRSQVGQVAASKNFTCARVKLLPCVGNQRGTKPRALRDALLEADSPFAFNHPPYVYRRLLCRFAIVHTPILHERPLAKRAELSCEQPPGFRYIGTLDTLSDSLNVLGLAIKIDKNNFWRRKDVDSRNFASS